MKLFPSASDDDMVYDTIIIGAGMSGLAAGVRLAHFEQRVCILERHHVIGGLNSFYRRKGRNIDVGLHALTNYAPKGVSSGPLGRLLRQLRIGWDELCLSPQRESAVVFPGASLRFSNDFELFASEVRRQFPGQEAKLRALVRNLPSYEQCLEPEVQGSARAVVGEFIDDPLLLEMLFCPILIYGGPREHDLDFGLFSVLFRSIFLEGFGRPAMGVRAILQRLVDRFKDLGGELRLRSAVRQIVSDGDRVEGVVLDDGTPLRARNVLSSAGWPETMRLCGTHPPEHDPAGRITFVEAISSLNCRPRDLGHRRTIVFYNDRPTFDYRKPREAVDLRSGTVCAPDNFAYAEESDERILRISCLANYDRWAELSPEQYAVAKQQWYEQMAASAARFVPDFRAAVTDTEFFTPVTIRRFTGHDGGAVYGASRKAHDGVTPLKNLYICGTDQGLVGVIGTLLSGISIANRWLLRREPVTQLG